MGFCILFAGDLEIVINGTRRHTRDVGTIFPSPCAFKNIRSSNTFGRSIQSGFPIPTASTSKPTQTLTDPKKDPSNKSSRTRCPNGAYYILTDTAFFYNSSFSPFLLLFYISHSLQGVSWFVAADELKCDGRKENQPQSESEPCPSQSQVWFEPYTRTRPWRETTREPLRERQNQQEQERPTESITATERDISDKPSALIRLSLQVCDEQLFYLSILKLVHTKDDNYNQEC